MSLARLAYVDMHTCGEPVRIVTSGYPDLTAPTLLAKRQEALRQHDHYRRALMLEPRGHAGMYGAIITQSRHPEAAFGVLFTHNEGYSTMCGHATIALGRYAVERGLVPAKEPVTQFAIEAPCGLVRLSCEVANGAAGRVTFHSVPAFVEALDVTIAVPGRGRVTCDIAYGGAYYAILPASRLGLDLAASRLRDLVEAAAALTDAIRAQLPIAHPSEPDLGFLYGTILTDGASGEAQSRNLCIFAQGQIDRSPTGSGVTARMALDHAKGLIGRDRPRRFASVTGGLFEGRVVDVADEGVTVAVSGQAYHSGEGVALIDADDPLAWGFSLPA